MPGSNSSMKKGMLNALGSAVKGEYSDLEQIINSESQNDDVIKYFGFKEDFSNYMTKVTLQIHGSFYGSCRYKSTLGD